MIAQAVAQMLTRAGLKVSLDAMTQSQFFARRNKREFGIWLAGWGSDTGEMSSPLKSLIATPNRDKGMGTTNPGGYSNPKVDALLEQALATVDDGKRAALLAEASRIAMADYGALPLHFEMTTWAFRKELAYTPRLDQSHPGHAGQAGAVRPAVLSSPRKRGPIVPPRRPRNTGSPLSRGRRRILSPIADYPRADHAGIPVPPSRAEPARGRRDGDAGVRRRLCARQSDRHPDQSRRRSDRARAGDRAARPRPAAVGAVLAVRQVGARRRSRPLLRARRAGGRPDPEPHAGDARARLRGAGAGGRHRHPARTDRRARAAIAARARHHDRLDHRLLAAEFLARADADPAVRGRAPDPAGGRTRRDPAAVRHRVVVPDARRASPPDPAGADARDLQGIAGDPPRLCGHARGAAAGLRAVRARQGPARRRGSSASTCSRSS